jgi:hypothetical protein
VAFDTSLADPSSIPKSTGSVKRFVQQRLSKCKSGERRLDGIELAEFCRIYGTGLRAFLDAAGVD